MGETYLPAQVCAVVRAVCGFEITPTHLRQWRHRHLLQGFTQEDERSWSRFSLQDTFEVCVMANAIKAGRTVRAAASIANAARRYAPGGRDQPKFREQDWLLVYPGIVFDYGPGEDDHLSPAPFLHAQKNIAEIFDQDAKARARRNTEFWLIIEISTIRRKVLAAVAELGEDA